MDKQTLNQIKQMSKMGMDADSIQSVLQQTNPGITTQQVQEAINKGNQSSFFDNFGIVNTAQASEMMPIEDLRTMPLGTQETFGEKLQPTIPTGGSIFTDRFKNFNQRVGETGIQQVVSPYEYTFNEDVLKEEEDAQYNLPEKSSIFSNILDSGLDYAKDIGGRYIASKALGGAGQILFGIPGAIVGTIGGLLGGGNLFNPNTYSQNAYNFSTPQGQKYIDTLYNPGGIMSGYNKVSAFGRGPLESITNRISKTSNPVIKQQLITAAKNITDSGQDTSKTGYNAVTQKGTYGYDDVNVGGSGTGGSGSKIVCTMMNESYGFGNFRNKIWLKHSKDLPKEYEIRYHTIFLPLVNFAKKEGKLNKLVKKTLEHIAKHRTIDLKQEMRGKKHLLGRIYRKVLEPICYLVGKIKNV